MTSTLRYVVLGALFTIPFIPLYVSGSLFFPFITGKGFLFRILVEIALVAYVVLACVDVRYRPRFSWVFVLYAGFVAWVFVADVLAINPGKALWSNYERMDGFVTLIHVFAFFVIAGAVLTADRLWKKWWLTFLAGSALVTLYGFIQILGLAEIHQGGVRLDASMGNAAYLAVYLVFAIAISLWHGLESKGWLRYLLIGLAVLQVIVLYFTATRGAILGFIAGAVLAALLYAFITRGKTRAIAIGAFVGVLTLVTLFVALKDSSFVQSDGTLSRLASISVTDGAPRLAIWQMALVGISERPLFGWGQEGFNYIFNSHYDPSMYAQEPWFDRAHNVYLDWAVAGGIPAVLLFIALLATAAFTLYRRDAETSVAERVFLASVLGAYALQALFVFDNLFSYVPLAAVLAMAHSARTKPFKRLEFAPAVSEQTAGTVLTPVAVVAGLVLIWSVNVPAILAANRLVYGLSQQSPAAGVALIQEAANTGSFGSQEVAEQAVSYASMAANAPGLTSAELAAVHTLAITLMSKEVADHPGDARLRLQLANAYRAAGDYVSARNEIEEAKKLSPKKQQIYLQAGFLDWQSGNKAAAAANFDAAYNLDPSFDDVAAYAAAGRFLTGRPEEARAILMNSFGTTSVDADVLLYAYYDAKLFNEAIAVLTLRAEQGGAMESYQLALGYNEAGRKAEARALTEATLKKYPGTVDIATQVRAEIERP